MRATGIALLAVLVLGALTAAVASAVRSTRGPAPAVPAARAMPQPVMPGAGATAPAAPAPSFGTPPPPGPGAARGVAPAPEAEEPPVVTAPAPTVASEAIGRPNRGRLRNGVLLAPEGADHTTWDAIEQRFPNRDWRRVGTDRLVRTILGVAARYRRENPGAPRVVVSDLSLPEGGRFGAEYGGLGHASHQNGLDVDIAYPRKDRQEVGVERVEQVDRKLSQALVTAFVEAGAQFVFVGPRTGLRGPRAVVQPLRHHDDHLHLRIPAR